MKRLTASNPDSNASQLLNYAYSEDRRVKLAYAGMKHNADLCEYISSEAGDAGLPCAPSPDDVMEGGCMECDCVFGVLNNVAIQAAELRARLMMIEDILGEDYDLEHLRELVKAERPLDLATRLIANGVTVQECGEWVHPKGYVVSNGFLCSNCGHEEVSHYPINPRSGGVCIAEENGNFFYPPKSNYCPNCGAKMMPQPPKGE